MALSPTVGLWLGFVLSLMIFSLIIRDNLLARLAQYILVGASTGYLMVLVIQDILRPKLFEPLLTSGTIAVDLLVPLLLGVGLVITGLNGTIRQGIKTPNKGSSPPSDVHAAAPSRPMHSLVTGFGRIALMIILGVGIANAITGTIQGTLIPQFWQATRVRSALDVTATVGEAVAAGDGTGTAVAAAVALFITIGTILHLFVLPQDAFSRGAKKRNVQPKAGAGVTGSAGSADVKEEQTSQVSAVSGWVANNLIIQGWAAIGKRAIWFVAGVLFARLAASRLSLLIARIEHLVQTLETTTFWTEFVQMMPPLF